MNTQKCVICRFIYRHWLSFIITVECLIKLNNTYLDIKRYLPGRDGAAGGGFKISIRLVIKSELPHGLTSTFKLVNISAPTFYSLQKDNSAWLLQYTVNIWNK